MGRNEIRRTMTTTTVKSGIVRVIAGKPIFEEVKTDIFNGNLTSEKAEKEIKKLHGANTVIIDITATTSTYEISVENFLKYATKVEEPTT